MYFSSLQAMQHLSMAASDNILGEKQYALFKNFLAPSEKLAYAYKF